MALELNKTEKQLLIMSTDIVVYYDESYTDVCIDRGFIQTISGYLQQKVTGAAAVVGDFILNTINEGTSFQKIIVLSQDMVPDTICERSGALIREYIDAGGNVVAY
jgi:hypothetical protein